MPSSVADILEEMVCDLYGTSAIKSVNKVQVQLYNDKCAPGTQKRSLAKIKGFNASPCKQVLTQKMSRSNYVAYDW